MGRQGLEIIILGADTAGLLTLRHCISEQLVELHRGQGMDIYWRDAQECPTEEEYKGMVRRS